MSQKYKGNKLQFEEELPLEYKFNLYPRYITKPFYDLCEKELILSIGPIASIICQDTFEYNPNITAQEFVIRLSIQITDSQEAKKFEKRLLINFLPTIFNTDLNLAKIRNEKQSCSDKEKSYSFPNIKSRFINLLPTSLGLLLLI